MACVGVGGDVGEVERLDCVLDARNVGGLGFLALGDAQVGDEVAETVMIFCAAPGIALFAVTLIAWIVWSVCVA